jgi:hypothetical protein
MKRLAFLLCATSLAAPAPTSAAQDRDLRISPAQVRTAPAEPRIALVIGNGRYKQSPLANPVNDARAIAKAVGRFVAYEYEETNSKGVVLRKERDELVSYRRASAPRKE